MRAVSSPARSSGPSACCGRDCPACGPSARLSDIGLPLQWASPAGSRRAGLVDQVIRRCLAPTTASISAISAGEGADVAAVGEIGSGRRAVGVQGMGVVLVTGTGATAACACLFHEFPPGRRGADRDATGGVAPLFPDMILVLVLGHERVEGRGILDLDLEEPRLAGRVPRFTRGGVVRRAPR